MNQNQLVAIVVSIVIIFLTIVAAWLFSKWVILYVWGATVLIPVLEVRRMRFRDYRLSYPYGPYTTFFFILILWPFAFPWFLSSWIDIARGMAKHHDDAPEQLSPLAMSLLEKSGRDRE